MTKSPPKKGGQKTPNPKGENKTMIDLKTCKKGDKLRLRSGIIAEYVQNDGPTATLNKYNNQILSKPYGYSWHKDDGAWDLIGGDKDVIEAL